MLEQRKSRYLASVLGPISCGLVICLMLILLPFQVRAAGDDEGAWEITSTSQVVRYATHGTMGTRFGFVKQAKQCNFDNLWLSWSFTNPHIRKLVGSEVTFLIDVDGTAFEIGVDLRRTYDPARYSHVALFTKFIAGSKFIDLLTNGNSIKIEMVGPREASELFDFPFDHFSLMGFAKARQQAEEICEGKLALKAVTQGFG